MCKAMKTLWSCRHVRGRLAHAMDEYISKYHLHMDPAGLGLFQACSVHSSDSDPSTCRIHGASAGDHRPLRVQHRTKFPIHAILEVDVRCHSCPSGSQVHTVHAGVMCQTALLMLNEKGVNFTRHLVDYRDPPPWCAAPCARAAKAVCEPTSWRVTAAHAGKPCMGGRGFLDDTVPEPTPAVRVINAARTARLFPAMVRKEGLGASVTMGHACLPCAGCATPWGRPCRRCGTSPPRTPGSGWPASTTSAPTWSSATPCRRSARWPRTTPPLCEGSLHACQDPPPAMRLSCMDVCKDGSAVMGG